MIIHNPILTGSFTVNGTDVASITSSAASITAINSYTASQNILNGTYTLTSSFAAQTASFTAFTSSVNSFTASQLVLNGTYATTGSNTFAGIQTVNSNLVVTGSITAQTLVVQTITSSVDFVTGSTRFGSISANTHVFTGSVSMNPGGLFVSSSNVGIGISSPTTQFNVYSNNASTLNAMAEFYNVDYTSTTRNFIRVRNGISVGSTYSSYFGQGADHKTYIIANNTSRNDIVIDGDNGNVGIGTNSPTYPLHVSASNGTLKLGITTNSIGIGNDSGGCYIEQYGTTAATSVFRIQSSKSGNSTDYTAISLDPYSGLSVTKSGTGANNVFASGVPIQVVYGAAIVSSGIQGTGVSLGTACNGDTPSSTQGIEIASVSFTPKKSNSLILIQTNSVAMWERTNISDHFYLWAANATDATILVKAGQYLLNFGSGGHNGGIVCLQGIAASWGTSAKTISFRIGSTGGGANYEYNPYYGTGGFSAATVGNFTYVITEIGQ